ncbi:MAG TPA: hypothetical protein PLN63_08430 [Paludibacteraceae bacterium]|nr:hypothetical protein [Paludibacteraceae bacterium]HOU69279.1 hypothetical protein [Paludibacteraceae bacterium]HPH63626.1 hypothetical protein [Paludibacteraceae bacterium]HQF51030.1 hypothetical protein [Paludibacteraceae bacterium]HQJ89779.1 hypothetical protein [Paludibacteraceae bacterium]
MKSFFLLLFSVLSVLASAQDIILTHTGEMIECKVMELNDNQIKYTYPKESIVSVISRSCVAKIKFESGREQVISEKIIVNSEADWEKVQITYSKDDVIGLKRVSEKTEKSSGTWSFSDNQGHFADKVIRKLKKEAARQGCHIIYIISSTGNDGSLFKDAHASMTGVMYKY